MRVFLLLLGLFSIFFQARSQSAQPRDTFVGNLQQKYSETVSRNAAQTFACGVAPVGSYYSSHFAGVDLKKHPEACGRCLRATCVDRTQCKSPFLNVTVAVIDDCPSCGESVSINSLAVRELTGKSLEEDSGQDLQVEWYLFPCSATSFQIDLQLSPTPTPAPEAELVAALNAETEKTEVKAAPSPPPSLSPLASTPSPEVVKEEANLALVPQEEIVKEVAFTPSEEETKTVVQQQQLVPPAPEPEVEIQDPEFISQGSTTPPAAPEEEIEVAATGTTREAYVIATPPAPVPPTPPSPRSQASSSPAPEEEYQQQNGNIAEVETKEISGLPGNDVLTLPRVGKVGLAVPVDYQPFPEQAFANIACGFASVSTHFNTHFAGLAASNEACGSCLAIRCADPAKCSPSSTTETVVQVVDTCGSCGVNDLNISPEALKEIIGETNQQGTSGYLDVMVTWKKVPCRGQTEGPMYLHMISGGSGNEYYAQMSLSNAAQEIQSVRINEQSLRKMSDSTGGGRWEWQNNGNKLNLSLPAVLEVIGMDGKVATVELKNFESQKLPAGGQI